MTENIHSKGEDLLNKGKFKEAIKTFKIILNINPRDKSAWAMLGICYDERDMYELAINSYKKAFRGIYSLLST